MVQYSNVPNRCNQRKHKNRPVFANRLGLLSEFKWFYPRTQISSFTDIIQHSLFYDINDHEQNLTQAFSKCFAKSGTEKIIKFL